MTRQARVGVVVLLGLMLFVLALFALANRTFLFSDRFVVRSQFNQVAGLRSGADVQFQPRDHEPLERSSGTVRFLHRVRPDR